MLGPCVDTMVHPCQRRECQRWPWYDVTRSRPEAVGCYVAAFFLDYRFRVSYITFSGSPTCVDVRFVGDRTRSECYGSELVPFAL